MSTQAAETQRSGWVEFTAVLMFAVAFFRIISAIAYFSKSNKIDDLSNGLFSSHVWAWGAWDLMIAVLAIFAGLSLLGGGAFGRVIGYIFGILLIVQGFTVLNIVPWYGAVAITLGVLIVYGLARTPREVSS